MLWIPFANFRMTTHVLDARTLGRQLFVCADVLETHVQSCRRKGHRAETLHALMWRDYPGAIIRMMVCALQEIRLRGYPQPLPDPRTAEGQRLYLVGEEISSRLDEIPPWLGSGSLHASHRSRLLREDPEWYMQFDWRELPSGDLEWPALMPRVGDPVVSESGEVRRVIAVESDGRYALAGEEPLLVYASPEELSSGVWRRAIEM